MTVMVTPRIEDAARTEKRRGVQFEWEVGTVGEKRMIALLSISHCKAGANYFTGEHTTEDYFSVTVRNETEEQWRRRPHQNTFPVRSFVVGKGIGIGRVPAGNRYSAKKLREAEAEGVAIFERFVAAGDDRVLAFFAESGAEGAT